MHTLPCIGAGKRLYVGNRRYGISACRQNAIDVVGPADIDQAGEAADVLIDGGARAVPAIAYVLALCPYLVGRVEGKASDDPKVRIARVLGARCCDPGDKRGGANGIGGMVRLKKGARADRRRDIGALRRRMVVYRIAAGGECRAVRDAGGPVPAIVETIKIDRARCDKPACISVECRQARRSRKRRKARPRSIREDFPQARLHLCRRAPCCS